VKKSGTEKKKKIVNSMNVRGEKMFDVHMLMNDKKKQKYDQLL